MFELFPSLITKLQSARGQRRRRVAAWCLGFAWLLGGWTRPGLPLKDYKPRTAGEVRLDYVLVLVNDEPHIVANGQDLRVLWGDRIEVREAALAPQAAAGGKSPLKLRVYGLVGPREGNGSDDRGQGFTTEQLRVKYSEDGKGEVYAVVAGGERSPYGAVYLHVLAPELEFAEVTINDHRQLLRGGAGLQVHRSDRFKVERVSTNIPRNAGVQIQLAPSGADGSSAVHFLRGGRVFATIPLKVVD